MITAVDTNVLIDVGVEDAARAREAAQALEACASEGPLVICDVVLAEFARGFPPDEDPARWMSDFGIAYDPILEETAVAAGRIHARHSESSGQRSRRPVADLLIGAHALRQANRLLTRDRGFYRDYFRGLRVIEPA